MGIIDQYTKASLRMNDALLADECGNTVTKVNSPTYDNVTKKFGSGSAYFNKICKFILLNQSIIL